MRQIILQEREEEAARQLQEEAKRAALAQAQLAAQEQSTTTSNQNSSLECIPEDGHSSRHRTRSLSIASDTGAEQSNTSFEDTLVDLRKKATLSDKRPPITAAVVAGMPTVLLNRKQNNGNKKSKIFGEDILQNVLSEEDVRADFLHIVHHLEDRAMAILNTEVCGTWVGGGDTCAIMLPCCVVLCCAVVYCPVQFVALCCDQSRTSLFKWLTVICSSVWSGLYISLLRAERTSTNRYC